MTANPFDVFEFGELNPIGDTVCRTRPDLAMPDGTMDTVMQGIKEVFTPNTVGAMGPYRGVVLRVEPPTNNTGFTAMVNSIAQQAPASGIVNIQDTLVRVKVRIPELHCALPVPTELPTRAESNLNHKIIDMYPTFTAKSTAILVEPMPGEIVWVDFGNKLTFEDPIYLGQVIDKSMLALAGGGVGALQLFNQMPPANLVGLGGLSYTPGKCKAPTPEQCSPEGASNIGLVALKIAISLLGQDPPKKASWDNVTDAYHGESNYMVAQGINSSKKTPKEGKGCDNCGDFIAAQRRKPYKPKRDYGPWCARFVNYCFIKAAEQLGYTDDETNKVIQKVDTGSSSSMKSRLKSIGLTIDPTGQTGTKPMPGDVILTKHNNPTIERPKGGGHTEIVEWFDEKNQLIHVICGNCGTKKGGVKPPGSDRRSFYPAFVKRAVRKVSDLMAPFGSRSKNGKASYGYLTHKSAGIMRVPDVPTTRQPDADLMALGGGRTNIVADGKWEDTGT